MGDISDTASWLHVELVAICNYVYGLFLFLIGLLVDNATKYKQQKTHSIPSPATDESSFDQHSLPSVDPEAGDEPFETSSSSPSSSDIECSLSPEQPKPNKAMTQTEEPAQQEDEESAGEGNILDSDSNASSSSPSTSPELPIVVPSLPPPPPATLEADSVLQAEEIPFQVVSRSSSRRGSRSKEEASHPTENQSSKKRQKKNNQKVASDQHQHQKPDQEKNNKKSSNSKKNNSKSSSKPQAATKKQHSQVVVQTPHQPNDDYYKHSALRIHHQARQPASLIPSSEDVLPTACVAIISPVRQPIGPPANNKDRGFSAEYKKARKTASVAATVSL